jgi:hypothetical protein
MLFEFTFIPLARKTKMIFQELGQLIRHYHQVDIDNHPSDDINNYLDKLIDHYTHLIETKQITDRVISMENN